jgi:hypothetical protein
MNELISCIESRLLPHETTEDFLIWSCGTTQPSSRYRFIKSYNRKHLNKIKTDGIMEDDLNRMFDIWRKFYGMVRIGR